MRWRSVRYSLLAALSLGGFGAAWAVDESRLWLPLSYQKFYLPLVRAAHAAQSLDRCEQLLEGTIDLDQSRAGHPMFRILCRQANGRSYNEMVDGVSFETLTTAKIVKPESTPEEIRQREAQQRVIQFWRVCHSNLLERTSWMMELYWLTEGMPEPDRDDEESIAFTVHFDAKNKRGHDLHFQAQCTVRGMEDLDVTIGRRQ